MSQNKSIKQINPELHQKNRPCQQEEEIKGVAIDIVLRNSLSVSENTRISPRNQPILKLDGTLDVVVALVLFSGDLRMEKGGGGGGGRGGE